jgi:hypothetical protein
MKFGSPSVYPPLPASSNTFTLSGHGYGNGTYIYSSSVNENAYYAFDKDYGNINGWTGTTNIYDARTGVYSPELGEVASSLGGISGEWVKIQLPEQIVLKSYKIHTRKGGTNTYKGYSPTQYVILGSNDGSTWDIVDDRRETNKVSDWTLNTQGTAVVPKQFTITSNVALYSRYAILVTVVGNSTETTGRGQLALDEWELYSDSYV